MSTQSYVYLSSNQGDGMYLHTVGFYDPQGHWQPESDHNTIEEAEDRINFLHGGTSVGLRDAYKEISAQNQELSKKYCALLDYAKNPGRYNKIQRRVLVESVER